ncbi:MAG: hypothetical protein AAFX57_07080 [Bacteroidota bacterium]
MNRILMFLTVIAIVSCNTQKQDIPSETIEEAPYTLAKPKQEWVTERAAAAKARLWASEAGKLVWQSIEYHGGLEKWWSNGPVYFRFNYQPKPGTGTPRDTYETADYWSSKTRHQRVSNQNEEYGWDGSQAWYYPADAEIPYNTRFWALTPYYFAGMPFVFADEGVNLTMEEDIAFEGNTHHVVRVTFGENVGDAPDDYYVLYINTETSRLAAIRYIVSYPGYFKDGGHSQEKLMTYEGEQVVNGITFPEKHRTFMWEEDGEPGAYVTDITLSDIEFRPNTDLSYFQRPEGSHTMQSLTD